MEAAKEQAEALQEKLKDMSPEELKEFQKQQCIFCHVVSGKVASKKIYEDESCLAILDINPANPGHILLLPKEHYSIMPQLNDEDIAHIFTVAKHLSNVLLKALKVEGTNIFVANGVAAGQRAQHMMIHIIPRKENDGLDIAIPQHDISESDINTVKDMLIKAIAEKIGTGFREEPKSESAKRKPRKEKQEVQKIKPEVIEAEFEEKKEIPKPKGYVKSQRSNKYHVTNCPFAKRIKKKVYLTKEQTKEFEPCTCTTDEHIAKSKEEVKKIVKPRKKAKKEKEVSLDDISKLLGAK